MHFQIFRYWWSVVSRWHINRKKKQQKLEPWKFQYFPWWTVTTA